MDDFQYLISSSLYKGTSDSYEDQVGSFYAQLLTDRQTNRQTHAGTWNITSRAAQTHVLHEF